MRAGGRPYTASTCAESRREKKTLMQDGAATFAAELLPEVVLVECSTWARRPHKVELKETKQWPQASVDACRACRVPPTLCPLGLGSWSRAESSESLVRVACRALQLPRRLWRAQWP